MHAHNFGGAVPPDLSYNDVYGNGNNYLSISDFGTGSISVDPQLETDHTLAASSPCIDAGDPDVAYNDPDGTRCDMGALYRHAGNPPMAVSVNYGPLAAGNRVFTLTPTIYWSYFDTAATSQVQYHLQVGTDDDWTIAEMWNTDEVESSDTAVVYAGSPLSDLTTYFVRLRVSNGTDWGDWTYGSLLTWMSCCGVYTGGFTGNADCDTAGKLNLSDITRIIDRVYLNPETELCCEENGNTNGDPLGKINLSDITAIIDHVYVTGQDLAECQ